MIINNKRKNIDLNVWHRDWIKAWSFTAIKENIKHFFKTIKYSFQRIRRGYCDSDLWCLDYYYLSLFYKTITDFAKNCYGYPCKGKWYTYEKWTEYLNDMAACFYQANEDSGYYENEYERAYLDQFDDIDFLSDLNKEKNQELHDKWIEDMKLINKCQNEDFEKGMEMLKESFHCLWD